MKKQLCKILLFTFLTLSFCMNMQAQVFNPDPNIADWSTYFSDFQIDTCPGGNSNNIRIERPTGTDGVEGRSWKITSPSNGRRAELAFTKGFKHNRGKNHYYSWRWRIDANSTITKDVTVFQWKTRNLGSFGTDGSQNYPLNMEYNNGQLKLYYFAPCKNSSGGFQNWGECKKSNGNQQFPSDRQYLLKSISVNENEWVELVLRIQRGEGESGSTAGKVQLWVNGSLQQLTIPGTSSTTNNLEVKTDDAPNNSYNNDSVYPKWGIYNNNSCDYTIQTWTNSLRVYDTHTDALNNLTNTRPSSENWPEVSPGKYIFASGYYQNNGSYAPSEANDANFNTRWASEQNGSNTYLAYDLEQHYYIKKVIAHFDTAYAYKLRVWIDNGDGWYWLKDHTTQYYSQEIPIETTARKISVQSLGGPWDHISIKELDVFGSYEYGKKANSKLGENSAPPAPNSSDIIEKSIKVLPNPVTNNFSIRLEGIKKADITITDILGKIVYKTTSENSVLNLSTDNIFKSGMYIISAKEDNFNQTYTAKLIVK